MIIVIRTIIIYIVVVFALRLMGKKQIGELEPSELAVAIMISDLATTPLSSKDIPLLNGVIPVIILSVLEIFVSVIVLKTIRIRKIITGTPSIIVEKGKLNEEELRNLRFTTDDLIEEMRLNGISDITDIQYAILENGGQVSFILNKKNSPLTYEDMNIDVDEDELPFPIINKGVILKTNLEIIGRNENWLEKKLKEKNITDKKKILLLTANHNEIKFIQMRS